MVGEVNREGGRIVSETPGPLQRPSLNLYTRHVERLAGFYRRLGFRETSRTPEQGSPVHVELRLGGFTFGVAAVDAAIVDHGDRRPRRQPDPARRASLTPGWCAGTLTARAPAASPAQHVPPVSRHAG